jgi:peptidyl-prolyl cis-trans isomerase A (cyclophilin A)
VSRSPLSSRLSLLIPLSAGLGCGPDADQVARAERLEQQVADLEKANKRLESEASKLHTQLRRMGDEVRAAQTEAVLARLGVDPGGALGATLTTSMGAIRCELWPDKAPKTVLNFVQLAEGGKEWTDPRTRQKTRARLYDGTIFHRVIPNFMLQAGDPLGNGTGGPGYEFADETDNGLRFDQPGLLAMANSGPNTNGSQFFITDRSKPEHLDGKHTIFGKCQDADVVQRIAEVPTGPRDRPVQDVVLQKVEIRR